MKAISQNKKAYHDYHIEDTLEAGIVLQGTEVKSIREGKANLKESYVLLRDEEAYLFNCHISPYSHGNIQNHEPTRTRKLLLHKKEIIKLVAAAAQKGYSILPLKLYFKGSRAKVLIGMAKGKRLYERRDSIKEREDKREMDRALKDRNR